MSMLCSGRLHEVTSSLSGINCQVIFISFYNSYSRSVGSMSSSEVRYLHRQNIEDKDILIKCPTTQDSHEGEDGRTNCMQCITSRGVLALTITLSASI